MGQSSHGPPTYGTSTRSVPENLRSRLTRNSQGHLTAKRLEARARPQVFVIVCPVPNPDQHAADSIPVIALFVGRGLEHYSLAEFIATHLRCLADVRHAGSVSPVTDTREFHASRTARGVSVGP